MEGSGEVASSVLNNFPPTRTSTLSLSPLARVLPSNYTAGTRVVMLTSMMADKEQVSMYDDQ